MEVTSAKDYVNRLDDNMNKYVDIISFNEYIGWYRIVKDAAKMVLKIPYDKPVIVSEFGGGAKYGLHGEKINVGLKNFKKIFILKILLCLTKLMV